MKICDSRRLLLRLRLFSRLIAAACCLTGFFLLPALSQSASTGQTDLSGYWVLRIPRGDGTYRDTYLNLKQSGDSLTGAIIGFGPRGIPIGGTFTDGKIHLASLPPAASSPAAARRFSFWKFAYDGVYQDGKLKLQTENYRHQIQQGIAERTTREATLPPKPLPLPSLRDLPDNGLARTPPMGWNSWNKFAGKVDDATVRSMADAMVSSGMSKLGYVYINIDDTWEGGRDAEGNIVPNRKFPDMKALADYVHSKGLKIGIYSSPGPKTCAGYEGSFGHEMQDARTYASWGIDYLKYDLCSANGIYKTTPEELQALYQKMGEALRKSGRPIVFSLCEYGDADVWKWGAKAGGNLWRTTGDIQDNWARMDKIGFSQLAIAGYARPRHWNDPDMLEVGNGGMNADEYRTHMSLWSLLSAPLIAGNDLRSMTEETKSILMNAEVIAIDQDPAAKPVKLLSKQGDVEILWRPLADGSVAVGIFNRGENSATGSFSWSSLNLGSSLNSGAPSGGLHARDLWKHQAVPVAGNRFSVVVPRHGVVLLRVSAASHKAVGTH